jgi:hypothetical protein
MRPVALSAAGSHGGLDSSILAAAKQTSVPCTSRETHVFADDRHAGHVSGCDIGAGGFSDFFRLKRVAHTQARLGTGTGSKKVAKTDALV